MKNYKHEEEEEVFFDKLRVFLRDANNSGLKGISSPLILLEFRRGPRRPAHLIEALDWNAARVSQSLTTLRNYNMIFLIDTAPFAPQEDRRLRRYDLTATGRALLRRTFPELFRRK